VLFRSGWVNLNIKTARSGNHYIELDTYEPIKNSSKPQSEPSVSSDDTDAPF
jgi:hypothetical protein